MSAAAGSVPLIWRFLRTNHADVNTRFGDAHDVTLPLFSCLLHDCQLLRCHSVGAGTLPCQTVVHSLLPLSSSSVFLGVPIRSFSWFYYQNHYSSQSYNVCLHSSANIFYLS